MSACVTTAWCRTCTSSASSGPTAEWRSFRCSSSGSPAYVRGPLRARAADSFTVRHSCSRCTSCRCRRRAGRRSRWSRRRSSCTRRCRTRTARTTRSSGVTHALLALQVAPGVKSVVAQSPATQVVPEAYLRQAPLPLHEPSVPHVATPWSAHWFSGSWPAGTACTCPPCPPARTTRTCPCRPSRSRRPARRSCAALARHRAGLAVGELAAAPADADVRRHAVGAALVQVVRQAGVAGRTGTDRTASWSPPGRRRRRRRSAAASASSRRRSRRRTACPPPRCGTRRRRCTSRPSRTSSTRSPRIAWRAWAPFRCDVAARPEAAGDRARLARPGARLVAAVSLRAEAGVALARHRAGRAGRLQRAGPALQMLGATQSRRRPCRWSGTPGRRVTLVRSARAHRGRGADARAVAGARRAWRSNPRSSRPRTACR